MKFINCKYTVIITIMLSLFGCSANNDIIIYNNLPKAKVILDKNPDEGNIYGADYTSISQKIYDKNVEIILLNIGKNDISLDDSIKAYGVYFILPGKRDDSNLNPWKYIVNADDEVKFTVSEQGNITKDK